MKTAFLKSLIYLAIAGISMTACKKEAPAAEDENELITTVRLKFTQGTTIQTFEFKDIDGDGGAAPTKFDRIVLKPNTTYTLAVELLDETKTPVENKTDEVKKEQDEHLFVFSPAPASLLSYSYGDKDSKGFNVGLTGTAKTTAAGTGTLRVQLRHQPPIGGVAAKNGTVGPGNDDVNLSFNLTVQ